MKKFVALVMAVAMVMSLAVAASAFSLVGPFDYSADKDTLSTGILEYGDTVYYALVDDTAAAPVFDYALVEKLKVKVSVIFHLCGLVPNPNEISLAGGICIPLVVVRLDDDRGRCLELGSGVARCELTPRLDLAGGLGSVYAKVSCLEYAGLGHRSRNVEVSGITVYVEFNGRF